MTSEPTAGSLSISIGADHAATRRIAQEARGRTLLIDFFASRCCTSVLVGDLKTRWLDPGPNAGLLRIGTAGATPIVADPGLARVLRQGRAQLVVGGWRGRSLRVRLDAPEAWLDFLDTPAARRLHGGANHGPISTPPTT